MRTCRSAHSQQDSRDPHVWIPIFRALSRANYTRDESLFDSLSHCNIGDEGACALAEALKSNRSLSAIM